MLDGLSDGSVDGCNDGMLLDNDDGVAGVCELGALVLLFTVAIFPLLFTNVCVQKIQYKMFLLMKKIV